MADRHLHAVGDAEPAATPARRGRPQPSWYDTKPSEGQTIRRVVIFQARCRRLGCDFNGPERQYKGDASYDLARHNIDRHGGNEREGARE